MKAGYIASLPLHKVPHSTSFCMLNAEKVLPWFFKSTKCTLYKSKSASSIYKKIKFWNHSQTVYVCLHSIPPFYYPQHIKILSSEPSWVTAASCKNVFYQQGRHLMLMQWVVKKLKSWCWALSCLSHELAALKRELILSWSPDSNDVQRLPWSL